MELLGELLKSRRAFRLLGKLLEGERAGNLLVLLLGGYLFFLLAFVM